MGGSNKDSDTPTGYGDRYREGIRPLLCGHVALLFALREALVDERQHTYQVRCVSVSDVRHGEQACDEVSERRTSTSNGRADERI